MKKIDLGQTISILANVGVIAGIVFLAVELRQNNALLAAQASYTQFSVERERRTSIFSDLGGIAELIYKERNGEIESLTPVERLKLNMWCRDVVDSWQWQWRENRANRLPDDMLNVEDWRGMWAGSPMLQNVYRDSADRRDPGFLRFMEESVFTE